MSLRAILDALRSVPVAPRAAARRTAQAHGYSGLNFRELADEVGIKAASIYHHFPSKADLGAAVSKRYWEDTAANLEAMFAETPDPVRCLRRYPDMFRRSLENGNRIVVKSVRSGAFSSLLCGAGFVNEAARAAWLSQ